MSTSEEGLGSGSPWRALALAALLAVVLTLALPTFLAVWRVNRAGILLNREHVTGKGADLEGALALLEPSPPPGANEDVSYWRTFGAAAARHPTEAAFQRLLAARRQGRLDRLGELWLGEVAAATGHWKEAHEAYARIDATNLLVDRGDRALERGDRGAASNWYLLAAVSVFAASDRAAAGSRQADSAVDPNASDPILRAPGRRAIALLRIGRGMLALGLPADAVPILQRAAEEMQTDPPGVRDRQAIQLSLAQALTESLPKEARARAQRLQTIRDLVGRAVALNRDLPTTLQAGRILALAGEQDQAIAMLQTAVRLGPQLAEAYLALGTVLQQNLLTLTARDVYRRGLERLPGNKELLGAYAVSMYKTSPPEEALPHLERAAATPTTDAYVFAYLGDCYAALGRTEEAQRAYERGLRRNAGATFLRDRLASFTHPGGMLR